MSMIAHTILPETSIALHAAWYRCSSPDLARASAAKGTLCAKATKALVRREANWEKRHYPHCALSPAVFHDEIIILAAFVMYGP